MGTQQWVPVIDMGKNKSKDGKNTMATKITVIEYKIPYRELIRKNGLGTCLEVVPGTRHYLTHDKHYGKEIEYGKN